MSEDLPPIIPTFNTLDFNKDFFVSSNDGLTFDEASKKFIRYPSAQGAVNLEQTTINGVLTANSTSEFKNQVTLNGTNGTDRQITASYYNLNDANNVTGNGGRIFQLGTSVILNNFANNAPILLRPTDGTGTLQTVIDLDTTSVDTKRPLLLNDTTTANNRAISSSFYNFYDSSVAGSTTLNGTLYNQAGAMYLQNTTNGGSQNFVLNDGGGIANTPLQLLNSGVNLNKSTLISANNNLTMAGGTGSINQTIVSADTTTNNNFKKTNVTINSNSTTGTAASGLEVFDTGLAAGRGCFILPNSGNNSLSDTNEQNTCAITSRSPQNGSSLTLSNWNSNFKNGIQIKTTDINNASTVIMNGQTTGSTWSELRLEYNKTNGLHNNSFNNPINFNPNTYGAISAQRRLLSGLGRLDFTDLSGAGFHGNYKSELYTDSYTGLSGEILPGMFYKNYMPNGYHQFSTVDSTGAITTPVFYGSQVASFSSTTFILRDVINTSSRLDFSVQPSGATNIRARTTQINQIGQINFNCDSVTISGIISNNPVISFTPSILSIRRPLQLQYLTFPSINTQLGFQTTISLTDVVISSQVAPSNFGNITNLPSGTWKIDVLMEIVGSGSHSLTTFEYGIGTATTSFTTSLPYVVSYIREPTTTIKTTKISKQFNLTLQLTAVTTIYFNEQLSWSGGGTATIGGYASYVRIG